MRAISVSIRVRPYASTSLGAAGWMKILRTWPSCSNTPWNCAQWDGSRRMTTAFFSLARISLSASGLGAMSAKGDGPGCAGSGEGALDDEEIGTPVAEAEDEGEAGDESE